MNRRWSLFVIEMRGILEFGNLFLHVFIEKKSIIGRLTWEKKLQRFFDSQIIEEKNTIRYVTLIIYYCYRLSLTSIVPIWMYLWCVHDEHSTSYKVKQQVDKQETTINMDDY